jgi:hypothetical protein
LCNNKKATPIVGGMNRKQCITGQVTEVCGGMYHTHGADAPDLTTKIKLMQNSAGEIAASFGFQISAQ